MNIKELKTLLKENKIHFYSYWDKKKLIALANEHNSLPKTELEKEKSKDVKYDRSKTIKQNPRKVMLEDVETSELKTFPSIYKAAKFIDQAPQTITYWGKKELGILNTGLLYYNFIIFLTHIIKLFFNLRFFFLL